MALFTKIAEDHFCIRALRDRYRLLFFDLDAAQLGVAAINLVGPVHLLDQRTEALLPPRCLAHCGNLLDGAAGYASERGDLVDRALGLALNTLRKFRRVFSGGCPA